MGVIPFITQAGPGVAGLGLAGLGRERHGMARQGEARLGFHKNIAMTAWFRFDSGLLADR